MAHEIGVNRRSVLYFISMLNCLFTLYFYHVAADKLISLATKMAASSVERY